MLILVVGVFIAMVTIQVSVTNNYDNPMYHAYFIPRYMYMYHNTMLFPYRKFVITVGTQKQY